MDIKEKIKIFKDIFVNRTDIYAVQCKRKKDDDEWGYRLVNEPLSDEIIEQHIEKNITIGVYPGYDSKTKWCCLDLDENNKEKIIHLYNKAKELGITAYIEFSGNKGFHLWVFFDKPTSNKQAKLIGKLIAKRAEIENIEIFPKQNITTKNKPGNLIKAPLGRHQATGKICEFLDERANTLQQEQWEFISTVKRVNASAVISKVLSLNQKKWKQRQKWNENKKNIARDNTHFALPKLLKPCVSAQINTGTVKGKRNIIAHIICCEMIKAGMQINLWNVLLDWNSRNQPPLSKKELYTVFKSVIKGKVYDYGCSPNGTLRNYLNCIGYSQCEYYNRLKRKDNLVA